MDSHLANLLRRSRQPHQRAAAANLKSSLEKKSMEHALDRRLTPEQLSAIQAANSRAAATTPATTSAARTTNPATPAGAATEAVGGVASRIQSSSAVTSSAVVRSSTVNDISPALPASSSRAVTSRTVASSTRAVPSSSTVRSTSSVAPSSSSTRPAAMTVTSTRALSSSSSSSSASSTLPTVSAAAASQSSESTGLGTGAIVGVALAVVVGIVVVGSCIGWCYRKHAQRKYSDKAPWAKLDDNVTPYPHDNEKSHHPDDDIYGQSQAPVIGSRRALALARQNGFNADGSMRPDSDYMMQRGDNNAGFGAGRGLGNQYGAYPTMDQNQGHYQNQGYDYGHEQGPPSPAYDYGPDQTGMAISAPGNTRQLVGPNGAPHGYPMPAPLAPVALGRPLPPQSAAEFADREEFMELPKPTPTNSSGNHMSQYSTYGLAYAESEPDYMPHTATTTGWPGDSKTQHTPLPTIEPASPLMSSFDFQKRQSLGPIASNFATKYGAGPNTLPNYQDEDENSRQKRMYGEVASAAGVMEPTTPHTADLSSSTNSYESASSFSTHQQSEPRSISHRLPPAPMPPLPTVNVLPPQPYQHGRPLSPLTEVETPRSMALTSSSVLHGQELNPFEAALHPPTPHSGFRPPYSASSSTGATAFPSPNFPPPSPGGMSVPGSVTDSPRKRESMFDVDDAYGGI